MAEALILEFEGVGQADYAAVNAALGIDVQSGQGDWPAGLRYHAGATKDGGLVVFEIWDSREAQEAFMHGRLGAALQQGGITTRPSRAEWLGLVAHTTVG